MVDDGSSREFALNAPLSLSCVEIYILIVTTVLLFIFAFGALKMCVCVCPEIS